MAAWHGRRLPSLVGQNHCTFSRPGTRESEASLKLQQRDTEEYAVPNILCIEAARVFFQQNPLLLRALLNKNS